MSLAEIERYFRHLDTDSFAAYSQRGAEPPAARIEAFEQKIGFALPDEFREFARHPLGGLYLEVRQELWPRPTEFAVGPFWSFLYGFFVYGLSPKCPDWMNLEQEWDAMAQEGCAHLVPFLRVLGNSDPYCFTPEGRIVLWRSEEPDDLEVVDQTFYGCLLAEIRELEIRKDRKIRGEDLPRPK